MGRSRFSASELAAKRKLVAVAVCPLCEENIYPHEMYVFFSDGYGHEHCVEFLRTQARLMRAMHE